MPVTDDKAGGVKTLSTSSEDRQRARLAGWQSIDGKKFESPAIAELYRQRTQRFADVLQLKQPDRVPSLMMAAGIVSPLRGHFVCRHLSTIPTSRSRRR